MKTIYTVLFNVFLVSALSVCNAEAILWDSSHNPVFNEDYSVNGNYKKLAEFMKDQGFYFSENKSPLDKNTLSGANIIVLTINVKEAYSKIEVESIINFVKNGGGVLALCDAKNFNHSGINNILESFGIICGKGDEIQQNGLTKVTISSDPIFSGISEISFKAAGQVKVRDKAGVRIVGSNIDGKSIDIIGVAEVEKGRIVAIGDMDVFANSLFTENEKFALAVFQWLSPNNESSAKPRNGTSEPRHKKPNGNSINIKREEVEKVAEGDCKEEQIDKELKEAKERVDEAKFVLEANISDSDQCRLFMAKYDELHSGLEGTKERLEKFRQACDSHGEVLEKKVKTFERERVDYNQCVEKKYSQPAGHNGEASPSPVTPPSALDVLRHYFGRKPHSDDGMGKPDNNGVVGCGNYNKDATISLHRIIMKYRRLDSLARKIETGVSFYDPEYRKQLDNESSNYSSIHEVEIQLKALSERKKLCERL